MKKKILIWLTALTLATLSVGAFASNRGQSAIIGSVIGAFAGAVIGQQTGGRNGVLPGVLIGAAAGAAIGSSAGDSRHEYRRSYDRSYGREPGRYAPPVRYAPRPVHYVPQRPVYRAPREYRDHGYDHRNQYDRGYEFSYGSSDDHGYGYGNQGQRGYR